MRQKSGPVKEPAEKVVKDIRRATRPLPRQSEAASSRSRDAVPGGHFLSQRRFQPPDLAFGTLNHLFLRIR